MLVVRLFRTILQASVLLALCSCTGSAAGQTSGLRSHAINHEGLARQYLLYTPSGIQRSNASRPLVIVLHGGGGTHRGMVRITKRRWNRLADQHGFLVAYPNATEKLWDFGEGRISARRKTRVNDLGFLDSMIATISASHMVDQSRVFATGISRGGQASFLLGCKLPGKIRAIAPISMVLPRYFVDDCEKGPPLGLALMMGTQDPLVPYDGGWIAVGKDRRDPVVSADETIDLFLTKNGCARQSSDSRKIDRPGDDTSVVLTVWTQCQGMPVSLYRIENGGHTWPSGRQFLPEFVIGEVSRDIDASDEAWRFFSQF